MRGIPQINSYTVTSVVLCDNLSHTSAEIDRMFNIPINTLTKINKGELLVDKKHI